MDPGSQAEASANPLASDDKCADTAELMRAAVPTPVRKPAPIRRSAWRFFAPIGIFVFTLMTFEPALEAGFVNWDDTVLVATNTAYRGFSSQSLSWMFSTSFAGHFQPLTWLSYAVDVALWGPDAFGFHLGNVVLHALTAVVFYFVARQLMVLGLGEPRAKWSDPFCLAATVSALLFAVHPLRAESVAWIAERRDVLGGLFCVLCVASYLRYAARPSALGPVEKVAGDKPPARGPSTSGLLAYFLAIVLFILSLLSKASAVTLVLVLVVLDFYPLRRLGRLRPPVNRATRYVWLEKLPFLVLGLLVGIRALMAQREAGALHSLGEYGLMSRFAQSCYGLTFYIWKTVLPAGLGPMYEIPDRGVLLGHMLWASLCAVVVVAVIVIQLRRRYPALAAALAVYVIMLLPVLGIAQSGRQLVADRYSYLPAMGLAVVAGVVLLQLIRGRWELGGRHRGPIGTLLASALVVVLAHQTFTQADIWQDPLSLWERGVRVSPNSSVANVNYADALARLARSNRSPEAVELYTRKSIHHYRKGLEIDPRDAIAWHHLAEQHLHLGQQDSAIACYIAGLKWNPNRRGAHLKLARLLIENGRPDYAVAVLRDGAKRTPGELDMIRYLAEVLATHPDDQIRNGMEAVKLAQGLTDASNGSDPIVLMTLATALAETGRFDQAVDIAGTALTIANKRQDERLIEELTVRLDQFTEGKPYRTE